ncbi:uncharacterized protein LOC129963442 isoform X2 [Argiope bruennichi]|uniref:Disheveled-associated activator of like protein n=2 Tax=Argiope bruennichi TaxID=94029 RepID=A0A8T0EX91_ARGBR|nr:uncharacterized protein LOC129963442 isoform X2 [Argiope bruennichi]KAF8782976.1 Disheveled-associated activator of like protein [Argiope bruennichi]
MIIEDRSRSTEGFPTSDWEAKNSKKGILRPRFMSAADYVFYLRRHLVAERRRNDPTVGHPGDETLSVGIPRLSFLLRRLEEDIQSSYLSFLEEFISDIHEGISCLLNILRTCQERQKGAGLFTYATCSRAKQSLINRGTIDEFYCLLCLKACSKSSGAVEKISYHKTGLSTIASCITSSHMKSRIVAIELLTVVCRAPEFGNSRVLEAMTTIRILFGESVRFKFLVSVLNSNITSSSGLETVTFVFLNTMLDQCTKLSDRVRIQSELEEAGLDVDALEKQLRQKYGNSTHRIWSEIQKWRELQIDLQDSLQKQHENMKLRKEVQLLRDALKRLRDERKGILNIHKQLKGQWNSMEQRLQDIALKSRVMSTPSTSSSDEECAGNPSQMQRYTLKPETIQPDIHDSELDEILIDIPTIPAGSILDVHSSGNPGLRIPDTPPPLPPNHPKLSDSGISSNSAPDSELDTNDWHYPDVPGVRLEKRHNSVRVRFSEATVGRRSISSGAVSDVPPGTVVLHPGQNRTKCADILGIQNIPPPPLPQRPNTPPKANQKKSHKKRSFSSSRDKNKEKGKSLLPRSLQSAQSKARTSSSTGNLTMVGSASNFPLPPENVKYSGNNKLWNKKLPPPQQRPPSQLGSSLDGMIHREIAKAIRDRHALFDP